MVVVNIKIKLVFKVLYTVVDYFIPTLLFIRMTVLILIK